jgi:hypothetical protein
MFNVPLITNFSVERRKFQFDTGIGTQHGAKRLVGLPTQVRFGMSMSASKRTVVQDEPTESLVDRHGLRQGHTRLIRETLPHL